MPTLNSISSSCEENCSRGATLKTQMSGVTSESELVPEKNCAPPKTTSISLPSACLKATAECAARAGNGVFGMSSDQRGARILDLWS
jgi:hypothetical protein